MKTYRIEKISGKPTSHIQPGYWVEGWAYHEPEVGDPFFLEPPLSSSLNEHFGWFTTTKVLKIDGDLITTQNSVWKVTEIT